MSWLFRSSTEDAAGASEQLVDDAVVDPEVGAASGTADSGGGFFSRLSMPAMPEALGGAAAEPAEAPAFSLCADLTYKTRLYGFAACLAMGMFMSLSATFFVGFIVIKPSKFALPYTLGAMFSLGSSFFLVGPKRFASTMFGPTRRAASAVYIACIFCTLLAALWLHSGLLTFVFVVAQFAAYVYLMASYIPFGRSMLRGVSSRASSMAMT